MSRCCAKKQVEYRPMIMPQPTSNCICSFPTLVILILIVLQFSRCGCGHDGDEDGEGCGCGNRSFPIGNGILFIIALFFLSCVGCGRGFGGGYGAY